MQPFFIGTRGSALALAQANWIKKELQSHFPQHIFELKIIKTLGDHLQKTTPDGSSPPLDKGLFTKELESALIKKEIDFAVHSLKDLPTVSPGELAVVAIPPRANPFDTLILKQNLSFEQLPYKAILGTGSFRRQKELLRLREDLQFVSLRGNIDTRLEKLRNHENWHGLILAAAGLERLGIKRADFYMTVLEPEIILPAPGQGALAVQTRVNDEQTQTLGKILNDSETRLCVETERQFLAGLGGGCQFPLGTYAQINKDKVELKIRFYDEKKQCHSFHYDFNLTTATKDSFLAAQNLKVLIN